MDKCDLWGIWSDICRVMMRHELTNKKTMTQTKTMTNIETLITFLILDDNNLSILCHPSYSWWLPLTSNICRMVYTKYFRVLNEAPLQRYTCVWIHSGAKSGFGDGGYRSPYLSHAKRALYHLSYVPICTPWPVRTVPHSDLSSFDEILEKNFR